MRLCRAANPSSHLLVCRPGIFLALLGIAACSGSSVAVTGEPDGGKKASLDASKESDTGTVEMHDGGTDDAGASRGDSGGSADAKGPVVSVRVNAVQTPVGSGGASQETPVDQRVGILGLTLLKDASDTSPLVVFRHSQPVDTPYNAGSSTVVGSAPASSLLAGTYTVARVPVDYVKFTVAGAYNEGAASVMGEFTDVIALSSGVTLQGATRARGWWSASFSVGGMTEGQTTGTDADIAQPGATSGIGLDLSGTVAAYVFPVNLTIPTNIDSDIEVVFTVNTYEDFHWQAESEPGYQPSVFEVSPTGFEPVTQLGANSFTVSLGPASGS